MPLIMTEPEIRKQLEENDEHKITLAPGEIAWHPNPNSVIHGAAHVTYTLADDGTIAVDLQPVEPAPKGKRKA